MQRYIDNNDWLQQDEIDGIWQHWRGAVAVPEAQAPPPLDLSDDWASGLAEEWPEESEGVSLAQPEPEWTTKVMKTCLSKVAAVAAQRQSMLEPAPPAPVAAPAATAARDHSAGLSGLAEQPPGPTDELWAGQHAQQRAVAQAAARRQQGRAEPPSAAGPAAIPRPERLAKPELEPEPEPEQAPGSSELVIGLRPEDNYWAAPTPQRTMSLHVLETDSEAGTSVLSDYGDDLGDDSGWGGGGGAQSLLEQSTHHPWVQEVDPGFTLEVSAQPPQAYPSEDDDFEDEDGARQHAEAGARRRGGVGHVQAVPTRRGAMTGQIELEAQYGSLDDHLQPAGGYGAAYAAYAAPSAMATEAPAGQRPSSGGSSSNSFDFRFQRKPTAGQIKTAQEIDADLASTPPPPLKSTVEKMFDPRAFLSEDDAASAATASVASSDDGGGSGGGQTNDYNDAEVIRQRMQAKFEILEKELDDLNQTVQVIESGTETRLFAMPF